MSIVRVGLAETKNFSEGYDLIFGKKEEKAEQKADEKADNKAAGEQPPQEKK